MFTGCSLIYEDYSHCTWDKANADLVIDVDWMYDSGADPEGMAYIFFPCGGYGDIWRFDIPGKNGGTVSVADGSYRVVCINDDTSGILFRGEDSYHRFSCYCREGGLYDGLGGTIDHPLGPSVTPSGESVEICPDMIWCGSVWELELEDDGEWVTTEENAESVYSPQRGVRLYPRPAVAHYSFIINDVKNLAGVRRMCASLSGMASEVYPATLKRGTEVVTLPLSAHVLGDDRIGGDFLTFGLPQDSTTPNKLMLYVWLTDGRKFSYEFDVTLQVRNAADPMRVTIAVGGISLPVSDPAGEGAFDVSIDGWITEVIDIVS
ncbi:DUF5119 domain-containing protein [uncultured Muribaculum sp.]|uniref:DUF5119 domain-containing protein n=1 Tax=uncultured Muribaculum sp. TaxID=1918613 RepID=UPI0025FE0B1E|nr:DUF5119 domain-containing protein [uncultured Muribaculum sp.]